MKEDLNKEVFFTKENRERGKEIKAKKQALFEKLEVATKELLLQQKEFTEHEISKLFSSSIVKLEMANQKVRSIISALEELGTTREEFDEAEKQKIKNIIEKDPTQDSLEARLSN